MKRLFNLFLAVVMIFSFTCIQVYAANGTGGSGNIDGGGGSMGDATSHGSWNPGNEGVRVTVVRASDHAVVTTPFDLTNKTPSAGIYHFGKVSKIQYNNGTGLSPVQGGYSYKNPVQPMPRIISTNGRNNIEAIKKYFCSEYVVKFIAEETGMDYDTLISGEYKILLEPIAYYKFQGVMIATTATEAALYDEVVGGQLRYWMGSLTAKNLPLSMFLETPDLGYPAWSGPTNKNVSNSDIKSSLGLGIVRFEEQPEEPEISTYDYEYRTNTEVITAVEVSGGQSDPDDPVTVQFHIDGTTYTVSNVYYPDGDSQLAWVRWTTPDEPQDMTIDVDVSGPGSAQATIHCKIVDLDENPPPNPVADDRNDSFTPSPVPDRPEKTSAQWTIWDPWWQEYWVWHGDDEDGYWCDHGWWEFDLDRYSASLSAAMEITPDEKNPTASDSTMKSGYGVNQVVTARVNSSQRSATTALQNAVSYLPEFNYESFWRLLDRMSISSSSSRLEFQKNEYSTYNRRTHFTPIWYPDGSYTVNTWVIDCWTPAGMLSVNLTDSLNIRGNLWDDWHIAPLDLWAGGEAMGYIRLDEQPGEVYHYTHRKNLDSILRDGRIRRMGDRECWFCASLEDTLTLMRATVMMEGKPYYKVGGSIGRYPKFVPEDYVILRLNPRFQKGEWVQWMQEMPPGSPPELLKAAETFSNLKLGFRGDLKFQQNPEVIEVAPLVEAAQTQFLDISFLM